jgi:hypothetical protein
MNIDKIAMGSIVRVGGDLYKKVSPMILAHVDTGELLYDARLCYPNAEPAQVEYVGRKCDIR